MKKRRDPGLWLITDPIRILLKLLTAIDVKR